MDGYHEKNSLMSASHLTWGIRVVPREISSLDIIFYIQGRDFFIGYIYYV